MTDATPALDLLRRQVAALLSQIDAGARPLPAPDQLNNRRHERPGAVWKANKNWRVFTIDTADSAGFVFVDHVCDDLTYAWGEAGDWEALRIEDARKIGLAYLAAADRAEAALAGAVRMDKFRRPESEDGPEVGEGAGEVRMFKPKEPRP